MGKIIWANLSIRAKVNMVKWALRNRRRLFLQFKNAGVKLQNLKNEEKTTISLKMGGMNT